MEERYQAAHKYSIYNKKMLEKSELCGCFYCCLLFQYEGIKEWIDGTPDPTALCPNCGIDSVIPRSEEYSLSVEFLEEMRGVWFW
ncbi:cytoplasmic protein [Enterococcus sp. DIV0756]|uniref:cytoplasmic protein n=1 Tax=Enterococcus sp. DIV0756 TaxID=2774636 RepID=UPI003F27DDB8